MENERILQIAKNILSEVVLSSVETIQVSTTTYDDKSKSVTIEISYPGKL